MTDYKYAVEQVEKFSKLYKDHLTEDLYILIDKYMIFETNSEREQKLHSLQHLFNIGTEIHFFHMIRERKFDLIC